MCVRESKSECVGIHMYVYFILIERNSEIKREIERERKIDSKQRDKVNQR